jgi:medium-chain acyl-[acyl-carrier-protein] hydrolase
VPAGHRPAGTWIRRYSPSSRVEAIRLFCFPPAGGGGAAYRGWSSGLPTDVGLYAVTLPGREDRFFEPPLTDLRQVVGEVSRAIAQLTDRPFAIFGHSLGALIGTEVARSLRRSTGRQPVHLFVSGSRAPSMVADPSNRHLWPDEDLLTLLRELNGTPAELLDSPEFARMLLPAFRADLGLIAGYRHRHDAPLDSPVTATSGTDDPALDPGDLRAWAELTVGPTSVATFPGDHFYLQQEPRALLRLISARLGGTW